MTTLSAEKQEFAKQIESNQEKFWKISDAIWSYAELGLEEYKSSKLLARKPHAAYYADLIPMMFPDDVQNIGELVTHCRKYEIEYVLYSLVEAKYRPQLRELLDIKRQHTGLERIFTNMFGVVYRVKAE